MRHPVVVMVVGFHFLLPLSLAPPEEVEFNLRFSPWIRSTHTKR